MEEHVIFIVHLFICQAGFFLRQNVLANGSDDTIDASVAETCPLTFERPADGDAACEMGMRETYAGEAGQVSFMPEVDEEFGVNVLVEYMACLFIDLAVRYEE
jgi:hypothetical protein